MVPEPWSMVKRPSLLPPVMLYLTSTPDEGRGINEGVTQHYRVKVSIHDDVWGMGREEELVVPRKMTRILTNEGREDDRREGKKMRMKIKKKMR